MIENMDPAEVLDKMSKGDRDTIAEGLKSWNYTFSSRALEAAIQYKVTGDDISESVLALTRDHTSVSCSVSVAMLAHAAADIMGIKEYTGENAWIKQAIKTGSVASGFGC